MDQPKRLLEGIEKLSLKLNKHQIDQILIYMQMIQTWNKAYNLVGTSDTDILIQKHLLDSLAIVPYITKGPVLDVGSGAGLPGIPLAIALPDISFTLLDSNGKKVRFMRQVTLQLNLNNVNTLQMRIQEYQAKIMPNTVLTRAFAPLEKTLNLLGQACAPRGLVQIMLGTYPQLSVNYKRFDEIQVIPISVPGLSSQRHLLIAQQGVNK